MYDRTGASGCSQPRTVWASRLRRPNAVIGASGSGCSSRAPWRCPDRPLPLRQRREILTQPATRRGRGRRKPHGLRQSLRRSRPRRTNEVKRSGGRRSGRRRSGRRRSERRRSGRRRSERRRSERRSRESLAPSSYQRQAAWHSLARRASVACGTSTGFLLVLALSLLSCRCSFWRKLETVATMTVAVEKCVSTPRAERCVSSFKLVTRVLWCTAGAVWSVGRTIVDSCCPAGTRSQARYSVITGKRINLSRCVQR